MKSILFDNPSFTLTKQPKPIMIASRELLPTTVASSGIVMQKILAIQQEILMINKHEKEHIVSNGEAGQLESSCGFCQQQNIVIHNRNGTDQREKERKKRLETLKEIERLVDISGKNGCVLVPKSWAGKRVKIILADEESY
ncbi:MAG TPA: DUF2080 family transposase-associated protein [Nitrososphaera sp.]|jgi:putative transposon-encoded protein|nr:DUF2080 family transposase-associated protein [Nitrososphaera sp.]